MPRALSAAREFGRRGPLLLALLAASLLCSATARAAAPAPPAPSAIALTRDGQRLFVACSSAQTVLVLDGGGVILQRIAVPAPPSGLALLPDESLLAATCAAPQSVVCLIEVASGRIVARMPAGHTATAPVVSPDSRFLFVAERFNDTLAVFDLATRAPVGRIPLTREPIAAAPTPDGRLLFVANHLPRPAAPGEPVAAVVSVVDTRTRTLRRSLTLPNGSTLLLGVAVSPDGRYAAVTHNLARFTLPTTQVERGWMNTAALTLIDVARLERTHTILLDNVERGAANPWAVAWTPDGRQLLVTHAGTHELSVIDFPALLARLAERTTDPSTDLALLVGLRQRLKLHGHGPRALAVAGSRAWIAGYFSDTLELLDLHARPPAPSVIALDPVAPMSAARRGERAFNDATLAFQHWQSCSNCHSFDARVDGLNWDLLNDGIGNPKNARSLLWSHRTPPAMSLGVRDSAEIAVRAGIRHILFAQPPAGVAADLDSYLKSLEPAPSPFLEYGRPSAAARRGARLFQDRKVGCATCHSGRHFTNLRSYDVGTAGPSDPPGATFDTPTLVELWRSAPFLHDGSARTIEDVLGSRNPQNRHGATSHLTPEQLSDLAAYLLSL